MAVPAGSYVPAVRAGSLVFTSGQLPVVGGVLIATGLVGADVTPDEAHECARICALNALAAAAAACDLESVSRVVKLTGFVASSPGFSAQPGVVNGASDVMSVAFGGQGAHAREAVGVAVLPLNAPVELSAVFEVL